MKFIDISSDFKHDGLPYYSGERRKVSDDLAGYFCGNGWAATDGESISPLDLTPKTLSVKGQRHGQSSPSIGVK